MSKAFWIVSNSRQPCIGLDQSDIDILSKVAHHKLPRKYIQFLELAGNRANMFDVACFPNNATRTVDDLLTLQATFHGRVDRSDIGDIGTDAWCFMQDREGYHFFYLNSGDNPIVHTFWDISYPVDNGWNEKHGSIQKREKLTVFINHHSEKKYGPSLFSTIGRYCMLIVFFPLLLLFWISLYFSKRQ
jgi:hypothetical protein